MSVTKDVRFSRTWQRGLGYLLMIGVTVLFAMPVVYMISTALRPEGTVYQYPIHWVSPDMTLDSFGKAIDT
jgi:ABC-type glycerol-3-phosphate transport system permease component